MVKDTVEKYLDCGNPKCGFARIRCPDCGAERLVMFSCKTRGFCPSCHAKRREEWGEWIQEKLILDTPHRQVVFTIPRMLCLKKPPLVSSPLFQQHLNRVIVLFFTGFACSVTKYIRDSYFPYQGKVVAIKRSWTDWLLFESGNKEHLIIQTPEGRTIDRVVPMQIRVIQGIEVGDYVVKNRGFQNKVKPHDKMTNQDIRFADLSIKKKTRQ